MSNVVPLKKICAHPKLESLRPSHPTGEKHEEVHTCPDCRGYVQVVWLKLHNYADDHELNPDWKVYSLSPVQT